MLDAHCHLDLYPDPSQIAIDAESAGVFVVCVTNHTSAFLAAEPHIRQFKKIRLALGLHPLNAELHTDQELSRFKGLVHRTSFIGEIGLDFSREGQKTRDRQLLSFRFALQCLQKRPKFITVHSRRRRVQCWISSIRNIRIPSYSIGIPAAKESGYCNRAWSFILDQSSDATERKRAAP